MSPAARPHRDVRPCCRWALLGAAVAAVYAVTGASVLGACVDAAEPLRLAGVPTMVGGAGGGAPQPVAGNGGAGQGGHVGAGGDGGEPCAPWQIAPPLGVACVMNVGNADFLDSTARAYVYKVKSCAVLEERVALLGDTACDHVALIELLGDDQCRCACDDSMKDVALCEDAGWAPNEPRCELCLGCGRPAPTAGPSCENQAAVVCDPERYDLRCSTSADPVGCDCLCERKLEACNLANDPAVEILLPPDGCDLGQQAICTTRVDPVSGFPFEATCLVHPSHCTGALGTDEDCIAECHTPLLAQAFDFLADHPGARQLALGDWNCGAAGECNYPGPDFCMWEGTLPSYALEKCPYGDTPTAQPNWLHTTPCILDFAVSNGCPACDQRVLAVDEGDHALVVIGEPCDG